MAANDLDPAARAMARNPEMARVERDIERTRERVSLSVMALRQAVSRQTDWREWVRRRPALFMAAAFGFGVLWGRRSGTRSAGRSAR